MSSPPRKRKWLWPAFMLLAVVVFYWIPLTSESASIQWDAVDVHLSAQKYLADRIVHGDLPFWTPYIFSGFPFLADPQVAAWYPPNWPFFLIGIEPRVLQAELVLHAAFALAGAFLFFSRFIANRAAAMTGAMLYAFSGFFAEHSSHLGMFTAASLLPWLLLGFVLAMEGRTLRHSVWAGVVGGILILAGHFQTALYSFAGLGLFAAAGVIERHKLGPRVGAILAGIAALAVLLSLIQILPGLELTQHSIRAGADYSGDTGRSLGVRGVLNLIWPNATGVFDHPDGSGITDAQYYLYSGFLLIPLAVLGLRNKPLRMIGLSLTVLPLWYMLGPAGGLYRIGGLLPGFRSVRSPIHFWFVPVFGLSLLACGGAAWVFERWKQKWVAPLLLAVVFIDLYYWNSLTNPLAYARYSYADLYGSREQLAQDKVAAVQPPLTRFSMPDRLAVFGPMNHPLDLRLEATYGYNPLELRAYAEYRAAMAANPRLQNGLNVSRYLDTKTGTIATNPDALPRAYFARTLVPAQSIEESRRNLQSLDPATSAIVMGSVPASLIDPQATVTVSADGEQAYRIRYRTSSPALLRVSVPYYPGWEATVDGHPCDLLRTDHALMGVAVPSGEKELLLRFRSRWFALGASVTGGTLALCVCFLAWLRFKDHAIQF